MTRRMPPLNALRAFEAAARHLSFTRAAAELCVTQAAVSHQIKALEAWLGAPLFQRLNRALALTDQGKAYFPPVRQAFDNIADVTGRLFGHDDDGGALTVSTMPSFAAKWLVMRLGRFQARYPDIDVRLHTTAALVNFAQQDVDAAIRFGVGGWPGVRAERLMGEEVFPVCAPALLRADRPLVRPDDLRFQPLLHDDYFINWPMWLDAAGVSGVDTSRGAFFNDSALMLQAAMAGQGVALARMVLVGDDLAAGRLVRLFDVSLPGDYAYFFVAPPHHFQRRRVQLFYDWLRGEATDSFAAPSPQKTLTAGKS